MKRSIAILSGDGIGPEVMDQTIRIIKKIEEKFGHQFHLQYGDVGGVAYDRYEKHLPEMTHQVCEYSDAILFGSVGGPLTESHLKKWQDCEKNSILVLRKKFQFSTNMRPIKVFRELNEISPLKESIVGANGIDFIILRELLGDVYTGEHKTYIENNLRIASDISLYNEKQIKILAHHSFRVAQKRKSKVTSVDKANALDTSKLWRTIMNEVSNQYPDVFLEHMLVDNCAYQFMVNPSQFDVIVTANLFGDILSDAAAGLTGSLGLIPSASFNEQGFALYEPSGGSAPNIAGKNIANPIAQILSFVLLLKHSFELFEEAILIEKAIHQTLKNGFRTQDLCFSDSNYVTSSKFTDIILSFI